MRKDRGKIHFVVDNPTVFTIGKSTNLLVRNPGDDLLDDFLALTSDDHVDIRATLKENLYLLRCLVASDDGADLGGSCETKSQMLSNWKSHRMLIHRRSISSLRAFSGNTSHSS